MPTPATKADSPFWQLPISALLGQVAASPDGLSSAEAAARLAQFGPNLIHGEKNKILSELNSTLFRRGISKYINDRRSERKSETLRRRKRRTRTTTTFRY